MFFFRNKCPGSPAYSEWKWPPHHICQWPWGCSQEGSGKCGQKITPWRLFSWKVPVFHKAEFLLLFQRINGILLSTHQASWLHWRYLANPGHRNFAASNLQKCLCLYLILIILLVTTVIINTSLPKALFLPLLPELSLINSWSDKMTNNQLLSTELFFNQTLLGHLFHNIFVRVFIL